MLNGCFLTFLSLKLIFVAVPLFALDRLAFLKNDVDHASAYVCWRSSAIFD